MRGKLEADFSAMPVDFASIREKLGELELKFSQRK